MLYHKLTGILQGTQDVGPVQFTLPATSVHAGKTVTLIDTPGFDDHDTRDVDILGRVAEYLSMTYGEGKRLTGVIYAQAIHTTRAGNSERTRNRLMKKLLGADAYHRVIIATTMWGRLSSESFGIVQSEQREANPDIWGDMIERGAEVVRHDDNQASALRIIDKIIDFGPPITLLIQSEMEQNGGRLSKTSAGRQLDADLGEQVAILRKQVEKLERDKEAQQAEKDELDAKIQALQNQRFKMRDWVVSVPSLAGAPWRASQIVSH